MSGWATEGLDLYFLRMLSCALRKYLRMIKCANKCSRHAEPALKKCNALNNVYTCWACPEKIRKKTGIMTKTISNFLLQSQSRLPMDASLYKNHENPWDQKSYYVPETNIIYLTNCCWFLKIPIDCFFLWGGGVVLGYCAYIISL